MRSLALLALAGLFSPWLFSFPPEPASKAARIVLVAGKGDNKLGEHEYFAGCSLFAEMLKQTYGVETIVVRNNWDDKTFTNARAIVFFLTGSGQQPHLDPKKLKSLQAAVEAGAGIVHLHNCIDYPLDRKSLPLEWAGGVWEKGLSCRGHWVSKVDDFGKHPVTRGVTPYEVDEGWLFHLNLLGKGVTPLVRVNPPEKMRSTPSAKKNSGKPETVGWAFENSQGRRAFTYTGGHIHSNWGKDGLRQLVVNGILWSAGLEIPEGGAPCKLDPALLKKNLENLPAPKKK